MSTDCVLEYSVYIQVINYFKYIWLLCGMAIRVIQTQNTGYYAI